MGIPGLGYEAWDTRDLSRLPRLPRLAEGRAVDRSRIAIFDRYLRLAYLENPPNPDRLKFISDSLLHEASGF
jgi:hypothetical protein